LVPILATLLIGVVTKLGLGLAATAAKKLLNKDPATEAAAPRTTFADELERATPAAAGVTSPAAISAPVSAPAPTPLGATDVPLSASAAVRVLAQRARLADAEAVRLAHGMRPPAAFAASSSTASAPAAGVAAPAASGGTEAGGGRLGSGALPVATRVPTRRRAGFFAHRMRQLHVAAYRRMDLAGR
jgi:hypothetical protein